jgi:hypothetical protein
MKAVNLQAATSSSTPETVLLGYCDLAYAGCTFQQKVAEIGLTFLARLQIG